MRRSMRTATAALVLFSACTRGGSVPTSEVQSAVTFTPPAEGAAFGISGTAPSLTPAAPLATQPVGALSGQGSVTALGTYHYSIPIQVPAGRLGMAPTVSLVYDS